MFFSVGFFFWYVEEFSRQSLWDHFVAISSKKKSIFREKKETLRKKNREIEIV